MSLIASEPFLVISLTYTRFALHCNRRLDYEIPEKVIDTQESFFCNRLLFKVSISIASFLTILVYVSALLQSLEIFS